MRLKKRKQSLAVAKKCGKFKFVIFFTSGASNPFFGGDSHENLLNKSGGAIIL